MRSLGSFPFFGKSSTLSRTGWPSEIISRGGSKTEATLALVTESKMSKKCNSGKRPVLMMKERAGRRMCADDGGQAKTESQSARVSAGARSRSEIPLLLSLLSGTVRLYVSPTLI